MGPVGGEVDLVVPRGNSIRAIRAGSWTREMEAMFSSRMPPRLRERAMLRVFRRSRRKFRQPRARGEGPRPKPSGAARPAGPGRSASPPAGRSPRRSWRACGRPGPPSPADDQGHQDGRSVVQGVEPLGEEGQAHQRPPAPPPASRPRLPRWRPSPWTIRRICRAVAPRSAQLAIALDLVLDGDAEDALDHQAAPASTSAPSTSTMGRTSRR